MNGFESVLKWYLELRTMSPDSVWITSREYLLPITRVMMSFLVPN